MPILGLPGDFPAVHAHFLAAGEIWDAFFAGRITAEARERQLAPLRAGLYTIETPSVPKLTHRVVR